MVNTRVHSETTYLHSIRDLGFNLRLHQKIDWYLSLMIKSYHQEWTPQVETLSNLKKKKVHIYSHHSISLHYQSISIGKFQFYSILPFQKVTLSLYHPILQYLQHSKTLFLLKYYFLIILYYFFPTITFFSDLVFLGFLTVNFFSSFSPSTSSTGSTHRATHTYP